MLFGPEALSTRSDDHNGSDENDLRRFEGKREGIRVQNISVSELCVTYFE